VPEATAELADSPAAAAVPAKGRQRGRQQLIEEEGDDDAEQQQQQGGAKKKVRGRVMLGEWFVIAGLRLSSSNSSLPCSMFWQRCTWIC
jgi:hypothetical protein